MLHDPPIPNYTEGFNLNAENKIIHSIQKIFIDILAL